MVPSPSKTLSEASHKTENKPSLLSDEDREAQINNLGSLVNVDINAESIKTAIINLQECVEDQDKRLHSHLNMIKDICERYSVFEDTYNENEENYK